MDVSLDELIKRNKLNSKSQRRNKVRGQNERKEVGGGGARKRGGVKRQGGRAAGGTGAPAKKGGGPVAGGVKKKKVSDLRLLIGGKPGARTARAPAPVVRDAREKLSNINKVTRVPDARHKLISRPSNINSQLMMRRARRNSVGARRKMDNRKPAYMDLEEARLKRSGGGGGTGSSLLYRTVDNDMNYLRDYSRPSAMVPALSTRPLHALVSSNRPHPHPHAHTLTPLMSDSWLEPSIQDITRFQVALHGSERWTMANASPMGKNLTRTFNQEDVWAQPHMPRSGAANGVSAKRRMEREEELAGHTQGYRIVVSNLQPSVTHEDIKELFEDIGSLYSSRVVRPGTAEVVYKNMEDAVKAVDTYHNRQLDGQPMKCLLVKPSNMSRMLSKGSVVPDVIAIHKALFNK